MRQKDESLCGKKLEGLKKKLLKTDCALGQSRYSAVSCRLLSRDRGGTRTPVPACPVETQNQAASLRGFLRGPRFGIFTGQNGVVVQLHHS